MRALLVLEPLAGRISPWWPALAAAFAARGCRTDELRIAWERPDWIETLDAAAGLDHREIGARILAGPFR